MTVTLDLIVFSNEWTFIYPQCPPKLSCFLKPDPFKTKPSSFSPSAITLVESVRFRKVYIFWYFTSLQSFSVKIFRNQLKVEIEFGYSEPGESVKFWRDLVQGQYVCFDGTNEFDWRDATSDYMEGNEVAMKGQENDTARFSEDRFKRRFSFKIYHGAWLYTTEGIFARY